MQEEASTNLERICSEEEANAYLGPCITSDTPNRFDSPVVKKEHYEKRQRVMRCHEETLSPLSDKSQESQNFSRCFDSREAWPFNFNLLQPLSTESDKDDGMQQELKELANMIMMRRHAKLEYRHQIYRKINMQSPQAEEAKKDAKITQEQKEI